MSGQRGDRGHADAANGAGEATDPREVRTGAEAAAEARDRRARVQCAALVILAVLAVLATLWAAAEFVLPVLFALVLNLLLLPGRRLLVERLRLPGAIAALVLVLVLLASVGAVLTAVSVPATDWVRRLPESLPQLQQKLGFVGPLMARAHDGLDRLQQLFAQAPSDAHTGGAGQDAAGHAAAAAPASGGMPIAGFGLVLLQGTRAVLGQGLTLTVVLFFLLASGDTLLRRVVEVLPRLHDKKRLVEITEEVERNISLYLLTVSLMNAVVGVANGVSMWLLGLPDPLLWGVLAFLLNYIPLLGPFTGVLVFFLVGLVSGPSLWSAVLPAGIYLLIHVAEGETVTPMLLARQFTLNPVLVIVSLFFWDWLWGIAGAFLAVPLLAIAKIVCDRVSPLQAIGHVIGPPRRGFRRAGAITERLPSRSG